MANTEKAAEVRRLNDRLRMTGEGGRIFITRGIQALDPQTVVNILAAVASFDAFNRDNDPYGEHDCATLEVEVTFSPESGSFG